MTCTRGERGENALATEGDPTDPEKLGELRAAELFGAAAELGLHDIRFLGGAGRWWDSGMADARVSHHRAFAEGDLAEQTAQLVPVIRETRPQVVITYDDNGGYGHPDHIRAHQATVAAIDAAANPSEYPLAGRPWSVAKLYAPAIPRSAFQTVAEYLPPPEDGVRSVAEDRPFGVPDELVVARIDAPELADAKVAAMRAHRTQLGVNAWFFELAKVPFRPLGVEFFQILRGTPAPPAPGEPEHDLFAGLT